MALRGLQGNLVCNGMTNRHMRSNDCRECISLVKELGYPVEHIVLPTFAVEHKLFVGPFARKFPSAKVHVAPRWDKPLDLVKPASLLTAEHCIEQSDQSAFVLEEAGRAACRVPTACHT